MNQRSKFLLLVGALFCYQAHAAETAPGINNFTKPFNEYSWVTAHNGYLNDMSVQLNRGVRGFMLDLHPGKLKATKEAYLCHVSKNSTCDARAHKKFSTALKEVFIPFLLSNPNAVVTLILENHMDNEGFLKSLQAVPELGNWVFDPEAYSGSSWPTLQQIIASNKRLIIFTDSKSGRYQVSGRTVPILLNNSWQTQNYWDLGLTALKHNWSCESRWSDKKHAIQTTTDSGVDNWKRLFVLNQFHRWGSSTAHAGHMDNNLTYLERRVDRHCATLIGQRKNPNYIAIDFNQTGDAFPYAAALSQGGFYFYEGNSASQDSVCVIPAGHNYNFRLASRGCENDEARSMRLRGVAKGTRITLFDSPTGSQKDDYVIIDVKRDIGINENNIVIGSFEKNFENRTFKIRAFYHNGLDGKVSRVKIEQKR